jgi:hypothetical protein
MSSTLTNSTCANACKGDFTYSNGDKKIDCRNECFSNVLPWLLNLLASLPVSVTINGEVRKIKHYKIETVNSDFNARIRSRDIAKLRKRGLDLGINIEGNLPTAYDAFNTLNETEKTYFTGYIHDLKSFVNRWIPGIFGRDVINYTGVNQSSRWNPQRLSQNKSLLQSNINTQFSGDNSSFSSISDDVPVSGDNVLSNEQQKPETTQILISNSEIEQNKQNKTKIEQAIDYLSTILHDAELNILYHAKARLNVVPDTVNIGKDEVDLEKLEALHAFLKIYAMSEALQRSSSAKLIICLTLENSINKNPWLPSKESLILPEAFTYNSISIGGTITDANFFQNLQWKLKTNTGLMGFDKLVLEFGR